jgi:hypothetical protein
VSALLALVLLGVLGGFLLPEGPSSDAPPTASTEPSPSASPSPAVPVRRSPREPVIRSNFADPDVLKHGGVYYAYATNDSGLRLPMATARNPRGPWQRLGTDGLPYLGPWAVDGRTWAPEVVPGPSGTFLLYYTAHHRASGEQCIGVATASRPIGPFRPIGDRPLVCPSRRAGAIDPAAFTDRDGTRYLLYKSDGHGSGGHPAAIYLQRMSADGLRGEGEPVRILVRDPRIDPILVEAPALVHRGGQYVLLHAAGVFFNSSYQTGYATAEKITGPYARGGAPLMSTDRYDKEIIGPGGADVFTDEEGDHIVFHGIIDFYGGQNVSRAMYVARLGWAGARPVVEGAPVRYEAERARLNRAEVMPGRNQASGGRAVGRIDHADSWVEFDVFAVVAGEQRIRVAYGPRSPGPLRHALLVNGAPVTEVGYAPGGEWRVAEVRAGLRAGWNTLRLRHAAGFAEIDYVDVLG